MTFTTPMTH